MSIEAPAPHLRRNCIAAAVLVVAVLVAVNGYYSYRSRTPTLWDDSSYLSGSLVLFDSLRDHGVAGFVRSFAHLSGNKAPLLCALPAYASLRHLLPRKH